MSTTGTPQQSARPLRNVDLCRQVSALRAEPPVAPPPVFPDADPGPAALSANAALRQLFRRPVTVPWLAGSGAYRSLAE
jgi:hypothetical protein